MAPIFLVVYVLFTAVLFAGVIHWARKKKREFKNPSTRHKVSPTSRFFVKDLPRDFYVSVRFCVGFALSGFLAIFLYKILFHYWE